MAGSSVNLIARSKLVADSNPLPVRASRNRAGADYVTATTEQTGQIWNRIEALTDTVIAAATAADITGTLTAITLGKGQSLDGTFTAFTLTSGTVIAYRA